MAASKSKKRKRKNIPTTDPAQSARFLEAAKKLEVDETGEAFERALDSLVKPGAGRSRPSGRKGRA